MNANAGVPPQLLRHSAVSKSNQPPIRVRAGPSKIGNYKKEHRRTYRWYCVSFPSSPHYHIIIDSFSSFSPPPLSLSSSRSKGPLTATAECLTALHAVCRISAALPGFSRFLVNLRVDSAAISSSERSPPCAIQPSSWRGESGPGGSLHDNLLLLPSLLT